MSALLAPTPQAGRSTRPVLRQVNVNPMRIPRVWFSVVLLGVLALGMVGLLVLNTQIQERSLVVSDAQTKADQLGSRQASLTARLDTLNSSSDLATKAWAMGMRPNPYPVFVQLGGGATVGQVIGDPTRVWGTEMPDQKYTQADDVTRAIEKSRADYAAALAAKKKAAAAAAAAKAKADAAAAKAEAARTTAARAAAAKATATPAASASAAGGH